MLGTTTATREDIFAFNEQNYSLLSRTFAFANALARYFNEETGEIVVSERTLLDTLVCSPRTISRMKSELRETGDWEIIPGTWKKPTTYIPLFIQGTKNEATSSD